VNVVILYPISLLSLCPTWWYWRAGYGPHPSVWWTGMYNVKQSQRDSDVQVHTHWSL